MQKTAIAFVAMPLAFAAAGFAGGQVLPAAVAPRATSAAAPAPTPTAAALVLDRLANEEEAEAAKLAKVSSTEPAPEAEVQAKNERSDSNVVRLGRMSVPVYRAHSVTYVVSEIGIEMRDTEAAMKYSEVENASRLRDAVLASMHKAAEGLSLTGGAVDSPQLSESLVSDLRQGFGEDVAQVLLLSLLQAEVPRS
ncbi:hypothetical protein [Marinovum sp.]|uniref:hypothetical protein n=1 Tax=Marinovum sp. TaxID=2024839 RepID=UPI002B273E93|nr:hypothetical protein [Marinovum sp.]